MTKRVVLEIDLRTSTLPDAIAAMVEAWYEAQGVEEDLAESVAENECLSFLMNVQVDKSFYDLINTLSVRQLMEIRLKQGQHVRSKAHNALANACGIGCYSHYPSSVSLDHDSTAFDGSQWQDKKWIQELSALPGVVNHESRLPGFGCIQIPKKYFAPFGLTFRSFGHGTE
jgi:hypothetical protein